MQLRSSPITYLQGFFNFLNSIIKTVKYQKLVQLNFLESFFEVLKNMKYLQKSWQLNSVEVNKLIFLCTFYNSYYFLPEFHFVSTLYDSFFIYCAWLRLSFLFLFFLSHYGIWSLWRSNHKNISWPILFNASGS